MAVLLSALRREVKDNLTLEGVTPPSSERMTQAINRGKNETMARVEILDQDEFVSRKSYSITAGQASFALPDGTTPGEPRWRRTLALTRTDLGCDLEAVIHNLTERDQYAGEINWPSYQSDRPYLYRENMTMYFTDRSGAKTAMTLVLRYAHHIADATNDDIGVTFDGIPDEWFDLLALHATMSLLPMGEAREKYRTEYMARLQLLSEAGQRKTKTGPLFVKYDPEGW